MLLLKLCARSTPLIGRLLLAASGLAEQCKLPSKEYQSKLENGSLLAPKGAPDSAIHVAW
jgi:hypothetical protein